MPVDLTPAIQRRITASLFTTESIFSAAFIASITLLAINATELGGSEAYAGVPSTIALLGRAMIAVPMGWLMDRTGRRPVVVLGYTFGMIGFFVSGLSVGWMSFLLLCLGAGLAGVANGTSQQARFIASEVWPQSHRGRIIGYIVFAGTVGAIFGPLLVPVAANLAEQAGLVANAGPYYLAAGLSALALILAFVLLRPDPILLSRVQDSRDQAASTEPPPLERPLSEIFARPMVRLAVASMVIGQLVMTLIMVITPVHMSHSAHTTGEISLVIMAHTLGMFGLAPLTGWLIERLGARPMMAYGALLLIISSVMAPWAASVLTLAIALFVLGLGWNFCFVAGSTLLGSQLHASERGRVQGTNDMLVALASGTGSLTTGVIFAGGGMWAIGLTGLALTLLFAVAGIWLARRSFVIQQGQGIAP
ncbi:MAG: MFS transporter [Caldilineaceae bacterium]|nr:MFS transporter [Caldilineaceae bacterium]